MRHIRQFYVVLACVPSALISLAGCGMLDSASTETKPVEALVKNVAGAVVGDEPQAVVEARSMLAAGGSAADGAVAMFFTLAATLPSSASLGSGGMCLVYDAKTSKVEALDFLARAPASIPAGAERPSAIPGSPLGFWTLHSRYGQLPWSQLVAGGERIARLGAPVSRGLLAEFGPVAAPLLQDAETRAVLADATGRPVVEGSTITQPNLARMLTAIRIGGATELYRGGLVRDFVAGVKAAGGSLEASDLDAYRAEWRQPIRVKYDSRLAYFAPPPVAAGTVEAQMFEMIESRGRFDAA